MNSQRCGTDFVVIDLGSTNETFVARERDAREAASHIVSD